MDNDAVVYNFLHEAAKRLSKLEKKLARNTKTWTPGDEHRRQHYKRCILHHEYVKTVLSKVAALRITKPQPRE